MAVKDLFNARDFRAEVFVVGNFIGVLHVDVGDLVVGCGEAVRSAGVEEFKALFFANTEGVGFAEVAVDVDGVVDGLDAVFAADNGTHTGFGEVVEELPDDRVEFRHEFGNFRMVWTEFLQTIVHVRQVGEG